jgi:phosphatidylglycerol:prolipoprotein diacylglycerol transferase
MFPTLSDLIGYLFNIHIRLPIQTFGFFVALSFFFTYLAFSSEFKRKESQGLIHAFKRKVVIGEPASILELFLNTLLGFVLGFKIGAIVLNYSAFTYDPKRFLLSASGNIYIGLIVGLSWGFWAWYDRKRSQLPEPKVIEETVHPYQLMGRITFWCGLIGFIGAKLFDTVEHINYFLANPVNDLLSSNGFTYYGGFIFGMLTFFYIGVKNGMRLAYVSDVGAPGIMLAYAIGRIGCQLSGDGDWGIVNTHLKPEWLYWLPNWMWSFNFPHNIANQGVYIPGCTGVYCNQLSQGVYPTSFYEVVICMLMFTGMWLVRRHITMPGLMSFLYLILMGIERFFIEYIRTTIKYNVFGLVLTQAQIISGLMFLVGMGGVIYVYLIKPGKHKRTLNNTRVIS